MLDPTAVPERPSLRERRRRDTAADISAAAADLFLDRGMDATTVADVAAVAGVSTRTFHRYFATKAESLTPVLREGLQRYLAAVAAVPATPQPVDELTGALAAALLDGFAGPDGPYRSDLVRLVVSSPELLAVWLRMHEECVLGLVPLLAARLDGDHDAVTLRLAATVVVTVNRLAVEAWAAGDGEIGDHLDHARRLLRQATGATS